MKVYIRLHLVGDGKIGRIIGRFTWGRFKHGSMAFVEENGDIRGFESNARDGCHFFDWEDLPNTVLRQVPCTNEQAYAMLARAKEIDGCGYDHWGIYGFVVRKKRENPDRFFCTEAVSDVTWAKGGGVRLQRMPHYKHSPMLMGASTVPEDVPRNRLLGD